MDGDMDRTRQLPASSSSRILDIPCKVCGDFSSGKHYNIYACDGCAGFFKRSIRKERHYICKTKGTCIIDRTHRNQCRACRLAKCEEAGMNKEAVQHERGPRTSTLRRQQLACFMANSENSRSPNSTSSMPITPQFSNLSMDPIIPPYLSTQMLMVPPINRLQMRPYPTIPLHPKDPAMICETAARLLFSNVSWAKQIPHFTTLPMEDQLILLGDSWRNLFILGALPYIQPTDLNSLIRISEIPKESPEYTTFMLRVNEFEDILLKLIEIHLDPHELVHMKLITLFKPIVQENNGASPVLRQQTVIEGIYNTLNQNLFRYLNTTKPLDADRFNKLMMMLEAVNTVSSDTIEKLFFKKNIYDTPISRIIVDVYKKHNSYPNVVF